MEYSFVVSVTKYTLKEEKGRKCLECDGNFSQVLASLTLTPKDPTSRPSNKGWN